MSSVPNGQETTLRPVSTSPMALLESPRLDRISAELKLKALELYRQSGNLYDSSRTCGIEPRLLRWHILNDPQFSACVDDIHREFVERAKGYMVQHMARPGNYMDRVTIARRFEPGHWGDTTRLAVEVTLPAIEAAVNRAKAIESTLEIDAKCDDRIGTAIEVNGINETATAKPPGGEGGSETGPAPHRRVKKPARKKARS